MTETRWFVLRNLAEFLSNIIELQHVSKQVASPSLRKYRVGLPVLCADGGPERSQWLTGTCENSLSDFTFFPPKGLGRRLVFLRCIYRESKRQLSSHVVCHFTDWDFAVRVAELYKKSLKVARSLVLRNLIYNSSSFGEAVAVYCENHTEHTDTLRVGGM
jgi:hypothetical protein